MKRREFGLLTNENVHPQVIEWLRGRGFVVVTASEAALRGADDLAVLQRATTENRAVDPGFDNLRMAIPTARPDPRSLAGFALPGSTGRMRNGRRSVRPGRPHEHNAALQRLRFYVGGTLRLTSFAVDDTWPGGRVGLVRLTSPTTTTLQWDNFKAGKDNNANGSIDDGGDYVFASYDFGSSHLTINLGYDNNGNLTDDGSLRFRYDGWNRLVRACYSAQDRSDPNQGFAQYSYLADGRRNEKVVTLRGNEAVANDGGNQTVRFQYGSRPGGRGDRSPHVRPIAGSPGDLAGTTTVVATALAIQCSWSEDLQDGNRHVRATGLHAP